MSPIAEILQRPGTAIMGIINATPDSFSDGGRFNGEQAAIDHGLKLIDDGADLLDIGGESTRPGADFVSPQEEADRVLPIIEGLTKVTDVPISIDTHKSEIMRLAVDAGASMINDVNALRSPGALQAAVLAQVPVCIMHMQGEPKSMQKSPCYEDVVTEIIRFLADRLEECELAGIARNQVIMDPGIGFGKSLQHNLQLLKAVPQLKTELGCDVLIGVSRKSMIDEVLGRAVDKRTAASVGLAVQAGLNGARIVRVHDVRETFDALRCVEAVNQV